MSVLYGTLPGAAGLGLGLGVRLAVGLGLALGLALVVGLGDAAVRTHEPHTTRVRPLLAKLR